MHDLIDISDIYQEQVNTGAKVFKLSMNIFLN